jgi:putative ABC transport system ATP-binding protein
MSSTLVIETQALSKVYHPGTEAEVVALNQVELKIGPGEFVAIMGPSGSGKSTLMNMIGCLDKPTAGRYFCDGVDVSTLDREELAQLRLQKLGFVFQGFNLLTRMDAVHNVMMPLAYANVPLARSGGQQQRVAIARALINKPPIILADEPTGALDSKTGEEILALFKRLKTEGHTIVLITHDAHVAEHADRTCVMRDGELHEAGAGA